MFALCNNQIGIMTKKMSALEYMLRYSDRTLEKRGRPIKNIDFINALKRTGGFDKLEATHFCTTVTNGIRNEDKANRYAKTFRDEFGIECQGFELLGNKKINIENKCN